MKEKKIKDNMFSVAFLEFFVVSKTALRIFEYLFTRFKSNS